MQLNRKELHELLEKQHYRIELELDSAINALQMTEKQLENLRSEENFLKLTIGKLEENFSQKFKVKISKIKN